MDEIRRKRANAQLNIDTWIQRTDTVLQQPLTAKHEEVREVISHINEGIEAFKVSQLDLDVGLTDPKEKQEAKELYEAVVKDAKHTANALVDILKFVTGEGKNSKDEDEASIGKDSEKQSTTASERRKLEAEWAALIAEEETLSRKHELERRRQEIDREVQRIQLTERTRKLELEEKFLKEQERREMNINGKRPKDNVEPPTTNLTSNDHLSDLRSIVQIMAAPKVELTKYNGDPLEYYYFIRSFEENVEKVVKDGASCLTRLIQYCEGRVKQVIQSCAPSDQGYERARDILERRFGDPYVISQAWVQKVTNTKTIKGNDAHALQVLADDLRNCYETLDAMGCLSEMSCLGKLARIVARMPVYLQNRWRREVVKMKRRRQLPSLKNLVTFVEDAVEEATDPVFGFIKTETSGQGRTYAKTHSKTNHAIGVQPKKDKVPSGSITCAICSGSHKIYACHMFKSMGVEERLDAACKGRLCFNCLGLGHNSKSCRSEGTCQGCGMKHHSLLHRDKGHFAYQAASGSSDSGHVEQGKPANVTSGYVSGATGDGMEERKVVLPIVTVYVKTPGGQKCVRTHVLLDTGSTNSFCSEELLDQLGIKGWKEDILLNTMVKKEDATRVRVASLEVTGTHGNRTLIMPAVLTRKSIPIGAHNVASSIDLEEWPHLQGLKVTTSHQGDVALLIGQDVPEALVPINVVKGKANEPYAVQTVLGWSISGPIKGQRRKMTATSYFVTTTLEEQVEQFWKMDMVGSMENNAMSFNDKRVLDKWDQEKKLHENHYHLPIPFKQKNPELPDN